MKKSISILLLFITCTSYGQVFDFKDGKLDLSQTFLIQKSFQFTVKSKLGMYASDYNGSVKFEANKMKDYITYEDSTTMTAIVKFLAVQTLQQTMWDGEVLFEKKGDSVLVKIEKLKLLSYSGFIGEATTIDGEGELTEKVNMKMQASMLKKLKARVEALFNKFRG